MKCKHKVCRIEAENTPEDIFRHICEQCGAVRVIQVRYEIHKDYRQVKARNRERRMFLDFTLNTERLYDYH